MTGGPYRDQDEEKNRLQIVERLIYTMSPRTIWTQVVILSFVMLGTLWEAHDMVTPRVVNHTRTIHTRCPPPPPPVQETPEQHHSTRVQDLSLCTRACDREQFISIRECRWKHSGVRSCDCECRPSKFGTMFDIREQR